MASKAFLGRIGVNWAGLLGCLLVACPAPEEVTPTPTAAPEACPWDQDGSIEAATAIEPGSDAEGYLCPLGDQDWYTVKVATGLDLLEVTLEVQAPVSPLDLTYAVWDGGATGVVASPTGAESATAGFPLVLVHQLAAGDYGLVVRDIAGDAEDIRHAYRLKLTPKEDPDLQEPNNELIDATASGKSPITGYIGFRGDMDYIRIQSPAHGILTTRLTMPASGLQPTLRLLDQAGKEIFRQVSEDGARAPTDLFQVQPLESGGTYYIALSDDDALDYNLETAYSLSYTVTVDPDPLESNDHPQEATQLSERDCGETWASSPSQTGYLATLGDVDWFALPLTGCERGLLEARASLSGSLPADLSLSLRAVRSVPTASCVLDQDCQELPLRCARDLDCAEYGNLCLSSGFCAGASLCLPEGLCGATLLAELAPPEKPNTVTLSAPLRGQDTLYLALSDDQSDAYLSQSSYALTVSVRRDPDLLEPNDVYTGGPLEADDAVSPQLALARDIPVLDCTGDEPVCCGTETFVEGRLSYAYDQDWLRYAHPCPDADCLLRIWYELDGGPVDVSLQVYRGSSLWYDDLFSTVDLPMQTAESGHYGGIEASDECFYAYQGHDGNPYYYYLALRDTRYVSSGHEQDGTWDYSPDQSYRVCIEKVYNGCSSPCKEYSNGCGQP